MSLPLRDYFRAEKIGEGSFGDVLTVYDEDGNEFAAKKFEEADDCSIDGGAIRELSILRALSSVPHPHILQLYDMCDLQEEGSKMICMVMPKYPCNLESLIQCKGIKNAAKLGIAHGLLCGVSFLHENRMIHRDIKSGNVLMAEDMTPVLCDFSLVKFHSHDQPADSGKKKKKKKEPKDAAKLTDEVGTPGYIAPEIYKQLPYNYKADVWSLGVTLLELFMNQVMPSEKEKDSYKVIDLQRAQLGDKPVPAMLKSMVREDPKERASCQDCLTCGVFDGMAAPEAQSQKVIIPDTPKIAIPEKTLLDLESQVRRHCSQLGYTDPMTLHAALAYVRRTTVKPLYCVIVAMKMYEVEVLDIEALFEYHDEYNKFDIDDFIEKEPQIIKSMHYCLYVSPPQKKK